MKLGFFAIITGIAVAVGLSKMKRPDTAPAISGPAPKARLPRKTARITGTAPQEGTLPTASARRRKANGTAQPTV